MPKLKVLDRNGRAHEVDAPFGRPLMFTLRDDAGLPVEGLCGGCAACGTCHVYIDEAWVDRLPPRGSSEAMMLDSLSHFDERASRLACQIVPTPELDIEGLTLRLAPEE